LEEQEEYRRKSLRDLSDAQRHEHESTEKMHLLRKHDAKRSKSFSFLGRKFKNSNIVLRHA